MINTALRYLFGAFMLIQAAAIFASDLAGFWSGTLSYRGEALEVNIRLHRDADKLAGKLDIPALVYARQPLPVSITDGESLVLEFPFGIGPMTVHQDGVDTLAGGREDFELELTRHSAPLHSHKTIDIGASEQKLEGTLHLPAGPGPHPVVVVIAGSGNSARNNWSYASWADFYLAQGLGALVYDRHPDMARLPDGSIAGIGDHANDVRDALGVLRREADVDGSRLGLAGHSRGSWIAMAVARQDSELAFLVLGSVAAATPGEQEMTSILTGMRDDGMDAAALAAARSYLRLYFYVAQTGEGWDLLAAEMAAHAESDWLQYVDQPRTLEDLAWWRANMNFDAISTLESINTPVLALWGGADFITPWADYQLKLESALEAAGNTDVTTRVFGGADHRLEVGFGEDEAGQWHWFGLAPGALETISGFVRRTTAVAGEDEP